MAGPRSTSQPRAGSSDAATPAGWLAVSMRDAALAWRGELGGMHPRRSVLAMLATAALLGVAAALHMAGRHHGPGASSSSSSASSSSRRLASSQLPVKAADLEPRRRGSFLVIGDWGWDHEAHGNIISNACQQEIANKMAAKFHELGDVKFVINVGDSFYPEGVSNKSDPQWQLKWRNMYARELRSVPWYSVYGNHDYHKDPCACSDSLADCAQVNKNESDLDLFYMPAPNWFKEHPELGLEVIGLDLNHYMWAWDHQTPPERQMCWDCKWTSCEERCERTMRSRAKQAFRLFRERAAASGAKILVAFSHYPTDYFWQAPDFLAGLSDASRHHVEYFGGHRHNTDNTSTISTAPNSNWLVGGGGGWSCERETENAPQQQGFVVGEISMDFNLKTYSVLVNTRICCPVV